MTSMVSVERGEVLQESARTLLAAIREWQLKFSLVLSFKAEHIAEDIRTSRQECRMHRQLFSAVQDKQYVSTIDKG